MHCKTFTLGAKEDDIRISLALQDRTVEALRTSVVDDVHLSHTIARLLELLTTNIRTRFLRFTPSDRVCCEGSVTHSRQTSSGVVDQWPSTINNNNNNVTEQQQQQQPSMDYMDASMRGGGVDPLAKIPAQPLNSTNLNVSFMPPPPSVYYNYYDAPSLSTRGGNDAEQEQQPSVEDDNDNDDDNVDNNNNYDAALPDWIALPLNQFFNSSSSAVVEQGLGGTGPMVGEFDMLEILLNEQTASSSYMG